MGISKKKLKRIEKIIVSYSQTDGAHHKAWVFDQIMRIIKTVDYDKFVKEYEYRDVYGKKTDEKTYTWDEGIAP